MDIPNEIAEKAGVTRNQAERATEILLEFLHRRLVEYRGFNGDYLGEKAHLELSDRAFYHLLGFVEQFSINYSWDEGSATEYLGRLPPVKRWQKFWKEIADWKWRKE